VRQDRLVGAFSRIVERNALYLSPYWLGLRVAGRVRTPKGICAERNREHVPVASLAMVCATILSAHAVPKPKLSEMQPARSHAAT
jgi:hypothetical protein